MVADLSVPVRSAPVDAGLQPRPTRG